jgi:hypothetical protein
VGAGFRLTARVGPEVRRDRFTSLEEALAALEQRLGGVCELEPAHALGRDYDPVRQVAGRFELSGPDGVRAGVDVRGDGSAEAYRGRIRKRLIERRPGESAIEALRRELAS